MAKVLITLLFLTSFACFGQRNKTVQVEDFNQDGVADTLVTWYEGGSGFGGQFMTITNGATGEKFALNNDGCFCEIKRVVILPEGLNKPENKAFLKTFEWEFFNEVRTQPDPSLQWILDGLESNEKPENNPYFDLIIDPQPTWEKGPLSLPAWYSVPLEGEALHKLLPADDKAKPQHGYLSYMGGVHFGDDRRPEFKVAKESDAYTIFRTRHGLVAQQGDKYKWIFVTDQDLTSAPEKLRWESVGRVALQDHYVILQQNTPPYDTYNIFVINIQSGVVGRLKFPLYCTELEDPKALRTFKIEADELMLNVNREEKSVSLKAIFEALEASTSQ